MPKSVTLSVDEYAAITEFLYREAMCLDDARLEDWMGLYSDEGVYWIVGRKKEMFISGGENVFEAEVEQAIMTHPEVRAAAVVSREDDKWGQVGVAFVEVESGADPATLRAWLRGQIAAYKVPKEVVVMAELPRTDSGKLRKVVLRERARLDAVPENGEE